MYDLLQKVKNYKPGLLTQRLSNLDENLVNDFLFSDSVYSLIKQICKKYKLDEYCAQEISMLLALLVTKMISNQEFVNELSSFVPEDYLNRFKQELEERLFSPFEVYLYKAGIAYKQITKLDPQITEKRTKQKEQKSSVSVPKTQTEPTDLTKQEQIPQTKQTQATQTETPQSKPQQSKPATTANQALISTPEVSPMQQEQKSPEVVVITEEETEVSNQAQTPLQTMTKTQSANLETPRIKIGEKKIPASAPELKTQEVPKPKLEEIRFSAPPKKPEIISEITASTQKQEISIPAPPPVPKTKIEGKEVIDLSNFSVTKQEDSDK